VLKDVGMTAADSGGKLTFYGLDPIIPSRIRFGAMAAIGLAAKSIAVAALWRTRKLATDRILLWMFEKLSSASAVSLSENGKRSTDGLRPWAPMRLTHSSSCRSSVKREMGATWWL
jgi:hypothetical protein